MKDCVGHKGAEKFISQRNIWFSPQFNMLLQKTFITPAIRRSQLFAFFQDFNKFPNTRSKQLYILTVNKMKAGKWPV